MNAFCNFFETLLGLGVEPRDLTFVQISLRGIIVFLATLMMVRFGTKRSLARKTPFDAILLVILAAVLSRAINGSAPFLATIGGGLVLVLDDGRRLPFFFSNSDGTITARGGLIDA